MKALKRINDFLIRILLAFCLFLVVVFTLVVFFQVLARNYLVISVPWTDEIALIFFVWSVFLGAAIGLRKRTHYMVDLFPKSWIRLNAFFDLFSSVLVIGMVFVFLWGGSIFAHMGLKRNFSSIIFSQAWLFVSMPLASACMILFSIENIAEDFTRFRNSLRGGTVE
ncbi:MAG: TRAP transporter small permease [Synergistaceae bacterium]|nr:TRAP transporter small permease [Synergistaceae bacterium]